MRRIAVEFLRRGPQHNQLLSPLTEYFAVCEDFPASVAHVPWEHAGLLRLLDELRYDVAGPSNTDRLGGARDEVGTQLARMLGSITGLPGSLMGSEQDDQLTHLRVIVSASELALLPFELSKTLVGAMSVGERFLQLQPERLICLTRHVRSARASPPPWWTEPNVLFVSGPDVPFERHLDALIRVVEPWQIEPLVAEQANPRLLCSDVLTVLQNGTLEEVGAVAAGRRFTHVHLLTHGVEIEDARSNRFGLALGDRVVGGEELARALSVVGGVPGQLPAVVTLAVCDSAAGGSVLTPGGSIAQDLHSGGVILVVASQFPLSEDASVPFVEEFYRGQLRGDHPFGTICTLRRDLANGFPEEHAWASITVYESLPLNFDSSLEQLRYWQSRRAHEKALRHLEELATSDEERKHSLDRIARPFGDDFASPTDQEYECRLDAVTAAAERLPTSGTYSAESNGLRASGLKRIAEVDFWLSLAPDISAERRHVLQSRVVGNLERSLTLYTSTMNELLANNDQRAQRKVTFHWIIGQVLVMRAILGRRQDDDQDLIGTASLTARLDLHHHDKQVRAWALVSLIELCLLRLATVPEHAAREITQSAVDKARKVVRLVGIDGEHVQTTRRQMRRYATWWGSPEFVDALRSFGFERTIDWDRENGVLATADAVVDAFTPSGGLPEARDRSVPVEASRSDVVLSAERTTTSGPPALRAPTPPRTGTVQIEMLPARNGDCLWLSYGETPGRQHYLMIDCGSVDVASIAKERIRSVPLVELLVLTHIDSDHISGALELLADPEIRARLADVWFNGWKQLRGFLSVTQGEQFSKLLDREDRTFLWNNTERSGDPPGPVAVDDGFPSVTLPGGMTVTVLSPTTAGLRRLAMHWRSAQREFDQSKAMLARRPRPALIANPGALVLEDLAAEGPTRDTSVPNLSSIALLAEFGGRAILLAGDAHADVLTAAIRSLQQERGVPGQPLRLDALKLSHHGSANATNVDLLRAINCPTYLVSTDGGIFFHPDRSAIARVILHGGVDVALHFNFRNDLNELWADPTLQKRYGYTAHYPNERAPGLSIAL